MATHEEWPERLWKSLEQAETEHLSYEQLEAYVDSRLDSSEAELVRAHTDLCAQCASELQDLADFAIRLKAKEIPSPVTSSLWSRMGAWLQHRPNLWAVAGAAAVVIVIVGLGYSAPPAAGPENPATNAASNGGPGRPGRPIEAILPPTTSAVLGTTAKPSGRPYRVLTQDEVAAYQKELSAAPNDPVARGAIALKYSLFDEAEKEYRQLEASGGSRAEEARRLLQQLQQLRGQ